jgi:hypothetical protein
VTGRRRAAELLAVDFFLATVVFDRRRVPDAFLADDVFPLRGTSPVDTRDECFGRCRTPLRGAASAVDARVNAAMSDTRIIWIALRVIESSTRITVSVRRDYDSPTPPESR